MRQAVRQAGDKPTPEDDFPEDEAKGRGLEPAVASHHSTREWKSPRA